jgi:hypothetical protein
MDTTEAEAPKVGGLPDTPEQVRRDIRRASETPRPEPPNADETDLIRRAANGEELTEEEHQDATDWLLQSFREELPTITDKLEINVGTPQHPTWIDWEIRSIDGAMIRRIREQAMNQRAMRRQGTQQASAGVAEAAFQANVRIVVEGSVKPDVKVAAGSTGVADPGIFLEQALNRKQGLIDQLAAEILGLSGYDDDDLRDAQEVRAAGN